MDRLFEPEQLALFSLPQKPPLPQKATVADAAALHFASEFHREYVERGYPERVPEDLNEFSLVCLMVIANYHTAPTARLLQQLYTCQNCLQTFQSWRVYDTLAFDLCLELLKYKPGGIQILTRSLNNSISGVRVFVFDLAWLMRHHLSANALTYSLLQNVEYTLRGWDRSLALCRGLYSQSDDFWQAVSEFSPERMPEQYALRIEGVRKEINIVEYHTHFMELELRLRRILDAYTFNTSY